jgi:hypothetical protein
MQISFPHRIEKSSVESKVPNASSGNLVRQLPMLYQPAGKLQVKAFGDIALDFFFDIFSILFA